jgi:branched-chain amino acid transport system substrate-binding protein
MENIYISIHNERSMVPGIRTRREFLLAASGPLTAASGCSGLAGRGTAGAPLEGETVRVGVMAHADGGAARSIFDGATVAATHLEATGGIAGADVELVTEETGDWHAESGGRRAHDRLCGEADCDLTVGCTTTEKLRPVLESVADHETVHLTTGTVSDAISETVGGDYDRYKYHFRAGLPGPDSLASALGSFVERVHEDAGWERAAVAAQNVSEAFPLQAAFTDAVGEVLDVVETYRWHGLDAGSSLTDVAEADPDVLFDVQLVGGTTKVDRWADREYGFEYGGFLVPATRRRSWDASDGRVESVFTLNAYETGTGDPDRESFLEAYRSETGRFPLYSGATTYDALLTYREAVEAIVEEDGSEFPSQEQIVERLETGSFSDGVVYDRVSYTGPDADRVHEPTWTSMDDDRVPVVQQWQPAGDRDGTLETVAPEGVRTASFRSRPWARR